MNTLPPLIGLLALTAMVLGIVVVLRNRRREHESFLRLQEAHAAQAERNRQLAILRELAATLLRVESLDELFQEAVRVGLTLYDAEGAALKLLTEEGRFLRVVAATGVTGDLIGRLLPADRSLSGWVATGDAWAVVDDVARDPRGREVEGQLLRGRRALVAPLRSGGLVLGTISVLRAPEAPPFEAQDVELLKMLADQVAVGIDRTRALEANRQTAEELAVKNQELVRATELKSAFLANMSHELRTPLNAIIGFSDLLLVGGVGELAETQREFLGSIARNGRHLLDLINNVLDVSKIEAGRMTYTLAPTDLREAITAAVADTRSLRSAKRQECVVDLEDGALSVIGDGQRIRQILYNLLSNASKFTPDGGHITLSATRTRAPLPVPADRARDGPRVLTRDAVWVAVRDTGIGIPAEEKSKLFIEFSQVDGSTSRRAQGTGLGLALCRKFVEVMGGTIGCESIAGRGSTFWFMLPIDGPVRRPDTGEAGEGEGVGVEADARAS